MRPEILEPIARYTRWLHGRWPAGTVEKLPVVGADGSTGVPGLYVVGDPSFAKRDRLPGGLVRDLVIVGAGSVPFSRSPIFS